MREAIAEMLKVEAQAKQVVDAADAEAAEIVRNARKEAAASQDAAHRAAQQLAAKTFDDGIAEARGRREQALAEIDKKAGELRNLDPDKARRAALLIRAAFTGETALVESPRQPVSSEQ